MTMSVRSPLLAAVASAVLFGAMAFAEGPVALPPPPAPPSGPPNAAARRGKVDFDRYCAECHGRAGDGRGPSAKRFAVAATNFTTGVYKCRSTPTDTLPTDDDLRRSIREGLDGTAMPQFLTLDPLQIDDMVETLKHFSSKFEHARAGVPIEVPPEPRSDGASIARGLKVYDQLKCANCHGWRGEGGPGAINLHNDDGSPAIVTDFTRKYSLACGSSPARIYTSIMTGLDGTPMSGYAEAVSPEDAWDLVHYVESTRR
jgi:cytochrome c oxidase cbb3-type subunit 2